MLNELDQPAAWQASRRQRLEEQKDAALERLPTPHLQSPTLDTFFNVCGAPFLNTNEWQRLSLVSHAARCIAASYLELSPSAAVQFSDDAIFSPANIAAFFARSTRRAFSEHARTPLLCVERVQSFRGANLPRSPTPFRSLTKLDCKVLMPAPSGGRVVGWGRMAHCGCLAPNPACPRALTCFSSPDRQISGSLATVQELDAEFFQACSATLLSLPRLEGLKLHHYRRGDCPLLLPPHLKRLELSNFKGTLGLDLSDPLSADRLALPSGLQRLTLPNCSALLTAGCLPPSLTELELRCADLHMGCGWAEVLPQGLLHFTVHRRVMTVDYSHGMEPGSLGELLLAAPGLQTLRFGGQQRVEGAAVPLSVLQVGDIQLHRSLTTIICPSHPVDNGTIFPRTLRKLHIESVKPAKGLSDGSVYIVAPALEWLCVEFSNAGLSVQATEQGDPPPLRHLDFSAPPSSRRVTNHNPALFQTLQPLWRTLTSLRLRFFRSGLQEVLNGLTSLTSLSLSCTKEPEALDLLHVPTLRSLTIEAPCRDLKISNLPPDLTELDLGVHPGDAALNLEISNRWQLRVLVAKGLSAGVFLDNKPFLDKVVITRPGAANSGEEWRNRVSSLVWWRMSGWGATKEFYSSNFDGLDD